MQTTEYQTSKIQFMKPMTKSPLQIARANYQPKLPAALLGNVALVEGAAT